MLLFRSWMSTVQRISKRKLCDVLDNPAALSSPTQTKRLKSSSKTMSSSSSSGSEVSSPPVSDLTANESALLTLQKERMAAVAASESKYSMTSEDPSSHLESTSSLTPTEDYAYPDYFRRVCPVPSIAFSGVSQTSSSSIASSAVESSVASITLSEKETQVFDTLLRFEREVFTQRTLPVTMRCAGGWVRDKLLGLESDDIDLAVDNVTGEEFGDALNVWYSESGDDHHSSPESLSSHSRSGAIKLGKIESNPDKSKHLASVTFKLAGLELDCTHLRSEEYASDSGRVPTVLFGSAIDDALRRDLTVNALFYNLQTRRIEDFTGQGISDLCAGVGRTPLRPMQTYQDDPLRVLRNIRHCITKLGFRMIPEMFEAMQNDEIHLALRRKVSAERFSTELVKMLRARSGFVHVAFDILVASGLARVLFYLPPSSEIVFSDDSFMMLGSEEDGDSDAQDRRFRNGVSFMRECEACLNGMNSSWNEAQNIIDRAKQAPKQSASIEEVLSLDVQKTTKSSLSKKMKSSKKQSKKKIQKPFFESDSERRKTLLFAAFLFDFHGLSWLKSKSGLSASSSTISGSVRIDAVKIVHWFCLECIPGLSKQLAKDTEMLHSYLQSMLDLLRKYPDLDCLFDEDRCCFSNEECNLMISRLISDMKECWSDVILLAYAKQLIRDDSDGDDDDGDGSGVSLISSFDPSKLIEKIQQSLLVNIHEWIPFWNGKTIMDEFGGTNEEEYPLKKGRMIGDLLKFVQLERMKNPCLTKDEAKMLCLKWLKSEYTLKKE